MNHPLTQEQPDEASTRYFNWLFENPIDWLQDIQFLQHDSRDDDVRPLEDYDGADYEFHWDLPQ